MRSARPAQTMQFLFPANVAWRLACTATCYRSGRGAPKNKLPEKQIIFSLELSNEKLYVMAAQCIQQMKLASTAAET